MDTSEHIAALYRDGQLLADAAERAGLTADVPSCPPWQVRDLLRHIGYVHRWAAGYIIERRTEPVPDRPDEPELLRSGPDDAGLLDWYRDGHARLVLALETAGPDLVCYSFLDAPSPHAFWARRQAHETAVHRVDAELATGGPITPVEASFGADGVDELIIGFFGRDADHLTDAQRPGGSRTLEVRATDTGAAWHLALTEDCTLATSVGRGPADSDCGLAGPAAGLYLLLWNRADPAAAQVEVSGDESVLAAWQEGMRVTWQ